MSRLGALQLFMFLIRCWMSAAVMVTGSFSGRFLWSAFKSYHHCASMLCVFSSSHIFFQYRSAFGGSGLIVVLHRSWKYPFHGSLENRAFIFFASASLVYLLLYILPVLRAFA